MPLTVLTRRSPIPPPQDGAARSSASHRIAVALVNNMPDSALEATAAQFARLLRSAAGPLQVELRLCYLPEVPRAPEVRDHLSCTYWHIDELLQGSHDGVIVTGLEPKAPRLTDEPYWGRFGQLLQWAQTHTFSSIWSCLAAHAAVLELDAIERRRLEQKCFGVFPHDVVPEHDLVRGLEAPFPTPHSRWNELPVAALRAAGYTILTSSPQSGVDLFVKQSRSLLVFLQGHLEYDEAALLKEYRRDVRRFLRARQSSYPALPEGYFSAAAAAVLHEFRDRALTAPSPELLASFPMEAASIGLHHGWDVSAVRIYANWLSLIAAAKRSGRALATEGI